MHRGNIHNSKITVPSTLTRNRANPDRVILRKCLNGKGLKNFKEIKAVQGVGNLEKFSLVLRMDKSLVLINDMICSIIWVENSTEEAK